MMTNIATTTINGHQVIGGYVEPYNGDLQVQLAKQLMSGIVRRISPMLMRAIDEKLAGELACNPSTLAEATRVALGHKYHIHRGDAMDRIQFMRSRVRGSTTDLRFILSNLEYLERDVRLTNEAKLMGEYKSIMSELMA